jgi:SM-20-related protein
MSIEDGSARPELFLMRGFLDAETCAAIRREARAAEGVPAVVYVEGSSNPVDETIRKTTRLLLSEETISFLERRLLEQLMSVGEHFKVELTSCELPQFLFYKEGDFFVRHQDGNTENLEFDHLRVRKVSVVIFLNDESSEPSAETFGGGSLVFHPRGRNGDARGAGYPLAGETGLLVAFRSETIHEVRPVTRGERYTIVTWYR